MQEVVALMDIPDGELMLLQNLEIAVTILGHVLGEEEKTPSAVISIENTPYDYTLRVFHLITVDLESQLDDPGDLLTYKNTWKEHLDAHWDHRHNTHTLWKTIHGLSNRAPPHTLNTSITFNYTHTHCELFHQTIHKHCQARNTQNKQTH